MYLGGVIKDAGFCFGDGLFLMSREKHQLAEVVTEALFVEVKLLLRFVFSSMVNGNADRSGELGSETSCFNFLKSESSSESGSVVISDGLTSDGGSKFIKRPGSNGSSSGSSVLKSSILPASLVEPGLDVSLPVFPKVDIGKDVVMLNHWR